MTVTSADSPGMNVKKFLRVICKLEGNNAGNKASVYVYPYLYLA